MHQRVVGLFAGVEQEVEGPPVLSPLDGCRRVESADGSYGKKRAERSERGRTSLLGEDLIWMLRRKHSRETFTVKPTLTGNEERQNISHRWGTDFCRPPLCGWVLAVVLTSDSCSLLTSVDSERTFMRGRALFSNRPEGNRYAMLLCQPQKKKQQMNWGVQGKANTQVCVCVTVCV